MLLNLAGRISPRILETPRRLDEAARQLEEYFAGRRTAFDLPLDLRLSAGFRRSVLAYLPAIGYGQTASYQSVAAAVHNPKAVRAVGTACATNPLPVVIPCHRVIRSDGQLGAYLGGPEIKHQLLDLEAAAMSTAGHRHDICVPAAGRRRRLGRGSPPSSTSSAAPCCHACSPSADARELIKLYDRDEAFRSTVTMGRHRFGEGEYRYLAAPLPKAVDELRHALYPHLLPIARDWYTKLGRPTPWPDTLDEWLEECHRAGQTKPTPLILKYGPGDWNALHRDLYGELVFPLQVVINLTEPGKDYTGGEFLLVEQRPRAQSRGTSIDAPSPPRDGVHHPGPPATDPARLVGRAGATRRVGGALAGSATPSASSSTTPPDERCSEDLHTDRSPTGRPYSQHQERDCRRAQRHQDLRSPRLPRRPSGPSLVVDTSAIECSSQIRHGDEGRLPALRGLYAR